MRFLDSTPFPALYFPHRNVKGHTRCVIVTRATFDIGQDGALTPSESQPAVNFEEQAYGDVVTTPIARESDIAPEKPRVDVIINALAHAPSGKPSSRFDVAFAVRENA